MSHRNGRWFWRNDLETAMCHGMWANQEPRFGLWLPIVPDIIFRGKLIGVRLTVPGEMHISRSVIEFNIIGGVLLPPETSMPGDIEHRDYVRAALRELLEGQP